MADAALLSAIASIVKFLASALELGVMWSKQGLDPNVEIAKVRSSVKEVEKAHDDVQDYIDDLWSEEK